MLNVELNYLYLRLVLVLITLEKQVWFPDLKIGRSFYCFEQLYTNSYDDVSASLLKGTAHLT